jgi:hypothetical protein
VALLFDGRRMVTDKTDCKGNELWI